MTRALLTELRLRIFGDARLYSLALDDEGDQEILFDIFQDHIDAVCERLAPKCENGHQPHAETRADNQRKATKS